MTAIALVTILTTILSIEDGLARLDRGLMAGLRLGDVGVIFYEVPVGGEVQRVKVSRGTIIDVDEFGAVMETEPEFRVQAGYSVEFEVPHDRIAPNAVLDLTRSRLRVRRNEPEAIQPLLDRIIPHDELVERHIWRLLENRRRERGLTPLAEIGATRSSDAAMRLQKTDAQNAALREQVETLEKEQATLRSALAVAQEEVARLSSAAPTPGAAAARPTEPRPPAQARSITGMSSAMAEDVLVDRVMDWAQAWSDQRVDAYLDFYAPSFVPNDGTDRQRWAKQRRQRIERPRLINVALSSIETHATDEDHAQVMFFQDYRSTGFSDRVFKRLTLTRHDGEWRILREELVDIDEPFESAPASADASLSASATSTSAPETRSAPVSLSTAPLSALVTSWSRAWSAQEVDGYLETYASRYRPDAGMSREEWAKQRAERIRTPRSIQVDITGLEAHRTAEDRGWVQFVQSYRSDRFRDVVTKRLDLITEDDEWKIVAETVVE